MISPNDIKQILNNMQYLRLTDPTIYLRVAMINIFSGIVNVTFSCDGSHHMPHDEFLMKGPSFWF